MPNLKFYIFILSADNNKVLALPSLSLVAVVQVNWMPAAGRCLNKFSKSPKYLQYDIIP